MAETQTLDATQVFQALDRWIRQGPGLDSREFADRNAFLSATMAITRDGQRARGALNAARYLTPAKPELLAQAFKAYGGVLTWNQETGQLDYAAQSHTFPTEYRKAAAAVLENYVSLWKQQFAAAHPQTYTYKSIPDVKAANQAVGQGWFSKAAMKFFDTKVESGLFGGRYFITSQQPPQGGRVFSVQQALPDGSVHSMGEFAALKNKREATRAAKALAARTE